MRSFAFLIATLCLPASPAFSGAWMREPGTSFTAIAFSTTYFRDTLNTSYLEFGLRDDLTLGADIGFAADSAGAQTGYATFFLRRPLGATDSDNKWAYELGIGGRWTGETILPHVKTALLWGRGLQLADRYGWLGVEAQVNWDVTHSLHEVKLDSTIGYGFSDMTSGMMQLFISSSNGNTRARLAPSIILSPGKGKYRFQIGAETPIHDPDKTSIKLGLWREF